MAIIMTPNIVYYIGHKDDPADRCKNKTVEVAEQIGRYGCFALMIFNIPYTYFNFWFDHALIVYLSVNGAFLLAYTVFWIVFWNADGLARALTLSILPSCVFLFSGIVLANIPLIAFAVLFAVFHIYISCKNANAKKTKRKRKTKREKLTEEIIMLFIILLLVCVVISILFGKDI